MIGTEFIYFFLQFKSEKRSSRLDIRLRLLCTGASQPCFASLGVWFCFKSQVCGQLIKNEHSLTVDRSYEHVVGYWS